MNDEWIETERELLSAISFLQEQYAIAAKPYIDRLVEIRNLRPIQPMILLIDQAMILGLMDRAEKEENRLLDSRRTYCMSDRCSDAEEEA